MDDFVEELERARREWAFVHGRAEIRWNAVWRGRIVAWVRKQQALGKVEPGHPLPLRAGALLMSRSVGIVLGFAPPRRITRIFSYKSQPCKLAQF